MVSPAHPRGCPTSPILTEKQCGSLRHHIKPKCRAKGASQAPPVENDLARLCIQQEHGGKWEKVGRYEQKTNGIRDGGIRGKTK